jgi:hypothetical protein
MPGNAFRMVSHELSSSVCFLDACVWGGLNLRLRCLPFANLI